MERKKRDMNINFCPTIPPLLHPLYGTGVDVSEGGCFSNTIYCQNIVSKYCIGT